MKLEYETKEGGERKGQIYSFDYVRRNGEIVETFLAILYADSLYWGRRILQKVLFHTTDIRPVKDYVDKGKKVNPENLRLQP